MPRTKILPYNWFDSPNIHLCTIKDFEVFCETHKIKILDKIFINSKSKVFNPTFSGNLSAFQAIFSISKSS